MQSHDTPQIDRVDRALLELLQRDARLTQEQLAQQVGLSPSAVQRRIRRLEQIGAIRGYRADIDPAALGVGLRALLSVRLEKHRAGSRHTPLEAFRAVTSTWPEVAECLILSGDMDCLLRVQVRDMQHYSHFVLQTLLRHESVLDVRSSFVLDEFRAWTGA